MHVSEEEQSQINRLVAEVEAKSGIQVLIVIVSRADAYPEIPWKAFAIGAVFSALLATAYAIQFPAGAAAHAAVLVSSVTIAGASLAALTLFVPGLARLFVARPRAEAEVRQYAEAVFLQRGLFETRERIGLLLLIARFEREAALVADAAIRSYIPDDQLAAAAAQVKPLLARNSMASACAACLNAITLQLEGRLTPSRAANEIADTLVQERGA
ncbi:MAG: TPM domain-containing protein [Betaproteobacteria bacterium]